MFIEVNGIRLYYEKSGSGEPLIMVHCHRRSHKIFRKAIKLLEKHYTVYSIDSRSHGKSTRVHELHYDDMAEDVYQFITMLGIEKPVFYGFSDGGIIGLILASKHPELLSKLIVSGASISPKSIKGFYMFFYKLCGFFDRSSKMQIIFREPNITDDMLRRITAKTYITCGSRDLIRQSHTEHISELIPDSLLKIFQGENHSSYIINSRKIADYIIETNSF